jgi:histidinol-phosphatase
MIERLKRTGVWAPRGLNAILDLVAGRLEAVIDPTGRSWDHAPAVILVEEAGGRFSDSYGGHRLDRGEGRFSNGLIHRDLEAALAGL